MRPSTDLASRWLGASVIAASDESFGEKENLLIPAAPVFEPGRYGPRGEIVDGWETRRRREPGHDWALIRLGVPGTITTVDVDTSFFTGNHPQSCRVEACGREGYPGPAELNDPATEWAELVRQSPLHGDTHNSFPVSDPRRFTHLRLSIYPDGGVARLRVAGQVIGDPRRLEQLTIDLASQQHGGVVVASSDEFYTPSCLLNRPGRARSMGEGWETRRRRGTGHDFVIFRLGYPGRVRQVIVDTAHFKYNASAAVAVYGCSREMAPSAGSPGWLPLLPHTVLQPDTRHVFPVACAEPVASVRVDAFPDGGLSRVRIIGSITPAARSAAGYRWLNSLPFRQAVQCLTDAGIGQEKADEIARQRPLDANWLNRLRTRSRDPGSDAANYRALQGLVALLEGDPPGWQDGNSTTWT